MATRTFSRKDIESLAGRLEDRGTSGLMDDMPSTQHDMRSAAAILRYFINVGVPVSPINIELFNGTV
jgi:hypothetical protein